MLGEPPHDDHCRLHRQAPAADFVPPGTDAFPGVVFPLEDTFMTVGAPPAPGSWETGKDAHVIRGPWWISGDQLVFDDERGRFILHPPELREHIARAEGSACCCTLRSMFQGYSRSSLA
jgi:hypothetical protein